MSEERGQLLSRLNGMSDLELIDRCYRGSQADQIVARELLELRRYTELRRTNRLLVVLTAVMAVPPLLQLLETIRPATATALLWHLLAAAAILTSWLL